MQRATSPGNGLPLLSPAMAVNIAPIVSHRAAETKRRKPSPWPSRSRAQTGACRTQTWVTPSAVTAKASRYHRAEAPKTASVPMQARKYSLSARWKNTSTLHVCAQFETGRDSSAGVRGDHGQILAEAELMGRYGRRAEQAA
jgi:hypothetical protein